MISDLKKSLRQDMRDEGKLSDIRASEGSGRKGPTGLSGGIPQSGYTRRSSRKKPGQDDNKEEKDRNAGATAPADVSI